MGEVYRARDTRLDRIVAVKVLPEHLSSNPRLRERFEREAKAISSLSHPHICPLYDVGHQDGVDFLVMEYLEGETLGHRLKKGPLPPEYVLQYAIHITDALHTAHRHGVIHRDLKPANIMLTKAGAKLLDFGLAKMRIAEAPAGMTALPTQTTPLTGEGTILGTLQYMAPEQLEGADADAQTDIFALGAVMYEMATGRKAFAGKSQASLISAIMSAQPPPISSPQSLMPRGLDHVVRLCIAKDPDARWQTAHDVMLELQWIVEEVSEAGISVPSLTREKNRERLAWTFLILTALAGLALAAVHFREAPPEVRSIRFSISPPDKAYFTGGVSISPDGRRLALVVSAEGRKLLWVRRLDALTAQPLPGTDGADDPFWSPDNRFIGFFAQGKLKKIEAGGGPVQTLCDAPDEAGGTWNSEGVIVFGREPVLYRVPAEGGLPTVATARDSSEVFSHIWPYFLPDNRRFLYTALFRESRKSGLYVGSLDSKETKRIMDTHWMAAYAPTFDGGKGQLLFIREGTLMAQPFDVNRLELAGEPVPVAEGITTDFNPAAAFITLSGNGILVYSSVRGEPPERTLVWVDRQGKARQLSAPARPYQFPRVSPDGQRLAVQINDGLRSDVWTYDLAREVLARLTYDGMSDHSNIVWAPDSKHLVFNSRRDGAWNIYMQDADGSGQGERLFASPNREAASSWTRDGRTLVFIYFIPPTDNGEIWALPFQGERKPQPLRRGPFQQWRATVFPDGRWLAFVSDESGQWEVYVTSFPSVQGKWQISSGGGGEVNWAPNGRELFWRNGDKMMAAKIDTKVGFVGAKPKLLFSGYVEGPPGIPEYDVAPDGQGFLMIKSIGAAPNVAQMNVVINAFEYLRGSSAIGKRK